VPDATGLELTAQELREIDRESVLDTEFHRDRAVLVAEPTRIHTILKHLQEKGFTALASLHGVDYYPHEPRLGVLYEMLDMKNVDRISVKARVHTEAPHIASVVELFPSFGKLRLMRQWAGAVDITPDTSPLMGRTPVQNLYINCGWGTGGYKAIPAGGDTMAYTVAHDRPHPLIEAFALDRFGRGALLDEGAAAGVAH